MLTHSNREKKVSLSEQPADISCDANYNACIAYAYYCSVGTVYVPYLFMFS